MPKLTDTQLIILSAAAQRDGGAALPLPKSVKLQGAAVNHVLNSLLKKNLLTEQPAGHDAAAWREFQGRPTPDARHQRYRQAGDRHRERSGSKEAVRDLQRTGEQAPGASEATGCGLEVEAPSSAAGGARWNQTVRLDRPAEPPGRRHYRRGGESHRLATALGARRHQRNSKEEARPRRHVRQDRRSRSGLSDLSQALTSIKRMPGKTPWPATTVP